MAGGPLFFVLGGHVNCLIVGGSSGLGLSLAGMLSGGYNVYVTGRRDPHRDHLKFITLDLSQSDGLLSRVQVALMELPTIDLLIYAAGFYQEGSITDLSVEQICEMLNVGLVAALYITRELLLKQDELGGFIAITSTSEWTPRPLEPIYTATKAALGMFANSLSLDSRVSKTLVVGPGGMATRFWEGTGKDITEMLDPGWVAQQILDLFADSFRYKYARIPRGADRADVRETRV